jgi:hypothetical protein
MLQQEREREKWLVLWDTCKMASGMNDVHDAPESGHPWEKSGLGRAPFAFDGSEVWEKGSPAFVCEACKKTVRVIVRVRDGTGRLLRIGPECLVKVEEDGAYRDYINSPEYRRRKIAAEKSLFKRGGASLSPEQSAQRRVS